MSDLRAWGFDDFIARLANTGLVARHYPSVPTLPNPDIHIFATFCKSTHEWNRITSNQIESNRIKSCETYLLTTIASNSFRSSYNDKQRFITKATSSSGTTGTYSFFNPASFIAFKKESLSIVCHSCSNWSITVLQASQVCCVPPPILSGSSSSYS